MDIVRKVVRKFYASFASWRNLAAKAKRKTLAALGAVLLALGALLGIFQMPFTESVIEEAVKGFCAGAMLGAVLWLLK